MSGVFLKEQEIKNLLNLGLGGLLRELKIIHKEFNAEKDEIKCGEIIRVTNELLTADIKPSERKKFD